MRRALVWLHRWLGLATAAFLVVVGLTGCVLSFFHEINGWLNPELYRVKVQAGPMLSPFELRDRALALAPGTRIDFVDLGREPGEVYTVWPAEEAGMATGRMVLDPYTGDVLVRNHGYWPLTRHNLMDFIYDLHFALALGSTGIWLLGLVATVWTVDTFIGLVLTLPTRLTGRRWWRRWSRAWKVKPASTGFKLHFDLHRAVGLWVWGALLVLAWSSVAFNFNGEVYQPLMRLAFEMRDPATDIAKLPKARVEPVVAWPQALGVARELMAEQAREAGFRVIAEKGLSWDADRGLHVYVVRSDRDIASKGPAGTQLYFDAASRRVAALALPSGQDAGTTVTGWFTALHTARVGGVTMQVVVLVCAVAIVLLSVTGVLVWWRKRQARVRARLLSPSLRAASLR